MELQMLARYKQPELLSITFPHGVPNARKWSQEIDKFLVQHFKKKKSLKKPNNVDVISPAFQAAAMIFAIIYDLPGKA